MQALIQLLDQALASLPEAADQVHQKLSVVWVDVPGAVRRWQSGGDPLERLRDLRGRCQDRLDIAIQLLATSAAFPTIYVNDLGRQLPDHMVMFDEDMIIQAGASQAADLIEAYLNGPPDQAIPPTLLDLLAANAADQAFATWLATHLPVADMAQFLSMLNDQRGQIVADVGLGAADQFRLDQFDQQYQAVLDGLGAAYGLAARKMPADQLTGLTEQFTAVFDNPWAAGTAVPLTLSLLIGHGQWPDSFLTDVTTAIMGAEGGSGVAHWALSGGAGLTDPGRAFADGSPVVLTDPMYGIWCAAVANPAWMLAMYQAGPTVDVTYDRAGYDGSEFNPHIPTHAGVDQSLFDLLTERDMDRASARALLMAGSAADTWAGLNGATSHIAPDMQAILGSFERDQRLKTWWDKWGHATLEGISAALGLAAIVVPGPGWIAGSLLVASFGVGTADAVTYAMEGRWWDAALEEVLLLPVGVGGVVKLIPVSRAVYAALTADQVVAGVDAAGRPGYFMPSMADDGTITVYWMGSAAQATGVDPATLAAYLTRATGDDGAATDFLITGQWPDGVQLPRDPSVFDPVPLGRLSWPTADGFTTDAAGNALSQPFTPRVGEVFDRYGPPDGRFTSPVVNGVSLSYGERSLPYIDDPSQLHTYEVTGDLSDIESYYDRAPADVQSHIDQIMERYGLSWGDLATASEGETAPAFNEPGGGVQVQWPLSIDDLIDLGILTEIN